VATSATRPVRTLAALGAVAALLLGLVALGGDWAPRLGLDLQGGTRITLQASTTDGDDITTEKLAQAQEIIAARVNGSGVAAPEVSTRGADQIIVEIPGERRGDIVDQVGRTAQLRFRLVWAGPAAGQAQPTPPPGGPGNGAGPGAGQSGQGGSDQGGSGQGGSDPGGNDQSGAGNGQGGADQGGADQRDPAGAGQTSDRSDRGLAGGTRAVAWTPPADGTDSGGSGGSGGGSGGGDPGSDPSEPPAEAPTEAPTEQPDTGAALAEMSLQEMIQTTVTGAPPEQYTAAFAQQTQELDAYTCPEAGAATNVPDETGEPLITCDADGFKYLLSPAVIEGTSLTDASAGLPQASPDWVVNLELDGPATDVFSDVTKALVGTGRLFAIVLDGQVLSAPEVNSPITNGQAQISGGFSQESSQELANSLQYGALPLSFEVNGVTLAGPTLAGSQLAAGILAGIVGLGLVVVYCMFYYRGLGVVVVASLAVAALLTYEVVILLGASVGFTLTLPGIAGLIVAVGITADSFIIFFERLRDEVREGKSLRLAVEAGWKRARTTILAADAVSLLAAVVLYTFAIDEIRGFAFALGLTTVIDVIVVFAFTKPLVSLLARTAFFGQGHKLSGLDAGHLGIEGRKVSELARGTRRPQGVAP